MNIDNDLEDADSLLSLVIDVAGRDFLDLFVDDGSVLSDIRDMMLRWAGVDDLDPTSRGSHADARELVYLETFVGEGYVQNYGNTPNPGSLAAESIDRVFEAAILPIAGRILAQAAGAELFLGDIVYDAATDSFSGFTGFNQTTLDALVTKSNDGTQVSDKVEFWKDVLRMVDHSVGVDNISTNDDSSVFDLNTMDQTYTGDATDETIYGVRVGYGGSGVDTIYGLDGNDIIYGYRSSYSYTAENYLYGGNGDDSIYGDRSDEELYYESTSAFSSIDAITDFDASDNDAIDIADLLSGYDPLTDAISDFVQITDNGTDSILSVDADGGADNFIQIATLTGVTGLTDENALETSGNLIAA